jgi:Putative transposase, YhgA-like
MEINQLTDESSVAFKEKLHHAHDKIWKMIFMLLPAMREYLEKIILPQLPGVSFDLDHLVLDNTSYLNPKLQPFYSDLVYLTTMTDSNGVQQPVKIALLLEHKSEMPSPLEMRIQLLEYIVAIKRRNYDSKTDTTLMVIPNVFNQFDKGWQMQPFRSLFPAASIQMARFIPEFDVLMTNLPDLSSETMDAFDHYGELRAGMLAMRHVNNKKFLLDNFEKIFVFLEQHPEKTILRNQLVVYLLSASNLRADELELLLQRILSPILKQEVKMYGTGFIAEAYREGLESARKEQRENAEKAKLAAEKARLAAIQLEKRALMMRSWKAALSIQVIEMITQVKQEDIEKLIAAFDKAKTYFESKTRVSIKKMMEISGLAEDEVVVLMKILKEK